MRFVVTGVTGFVGSHFAERALGEGHEVVGVCNSSGPKKADLRADLIARGAELVDGDILSADSLRSVMDGADCVVHFAAAFRESGMDDEYFLQLNVKGTANVINAAAANARRFVLCSTAGIYGQRVPGAIDEAAEAKPWNIYERSKLEAEKTTREMATQLGIEYVILRPASVYGPRDERLLKLFKSAAKGRFPLFGAGAGRRHMIYVTDLADAFLRACVEPLAAFEELIIAGPKAVPLKEMLEELALVVGRPQCGPTLPLGPMLAISALVEDLASVIRVKPPIYRRRMDFYINDAAFSTRRAEKVLGWRPQVDLRDGLSRTFEAYCKQGAIVGSASIAFATSGMEIHAFVLASNWVCLMLPAII